MADTTRGQLAFQELKRAYESGEIYIGVDTGKYKRSGSPFRGAWGTNSKNRVHGRVIDFALSDLSRWWMLWKEGGLSLCREKEQIYSPKGYWIDFVIKSNERP